MSHPLAGNIRRLRRERKLSQQALAELLGVSVAAVSKWESGVSRPHISMLLRLAGFFEVSTDAMLGHQAGLTSAQQEAKRIKALAQAKRFDEGMEAADRALMQFPNHFDLAFESALLYGLCHLEKGDQAAGEKAITLLKRAAALISQNTRPEVSLISIQGETAFTLMNMGRHEEALRIYRASNQAGMYDQAIGGALFTLGRYEEALQPLSDGYLGTLAKGFNSLTMLAMSLADLNRTAEGLSVLHSLIGCLKLLKNLGRVSGIERMLCGALGMRAVLECSLSAPPQDQAIDIRFEGVSFRYPGTDRDVLKDFSLHIPVGQRLALVGINGAGKTTLIKLLLGFFEPQSGRILINGESVQAYRKREL